MYNGRAPNGWSNCEMAFLPPLLAISIAAHFAPNPSATHRRARISLFPGHVRVAYTVDKSPLKVGLYTPGMHLPVLPVETLLERKPDYVLILAWNFADEILRQQQEFRDGGGRFIIPIPEPKVV